MLELGELVLGEALQVQGMERLHKSLSTFSAADVGHGQGYDGGEARRPVKQLQHGLLSLGPAPDSDITWFRTFTIAAASMPNLELGCVL